MHPRSYYLGNLIHYVVNHSQKVFLNIEKFSPHQAHINIPFISEIHLYRNLPIFIQFTKSSRLWWIVLYFLDIPNGVAKQLEKFDPFRKYFEQPASVIYEDFDLKESNSTPEKGDIFFVDDGTLAVSEGSFYLEFKTSRGLLNIFVGRVLLLGDRLQTPHHRIIYTVNNHHHNGSQVSLLKVEDHAPREIDINPDFETLEGRGNSIGGLISVSRREDHFLVGAI